MSVDARQGASLSVRTLLRPTAFFALFTACFSFFRVLSLLALRKWDVALGPGCAVAFGWDLAIAAGVFGLHRASHLASRNHRPLRAVALALGAATVGFALVARAADVAYAALTGGHWNSAGFLYVDPRYVSLLRDGDGPLLVGCLLAALACAWVALFFDARLLWRRATPGATVDRRTPFALALGSTCVLALPLGAGFNAAEEDDALFVPEALFVHEWLAWRDQLTTSTDALELPAATLRRFVQLGLAAEKPLDPAYPLSHATLDTTPFPYPRVAGAPRHPNVVFTLVEQLNREFVHAWSGELLGVMPGLSALAQRMTMVTDYQSTASPTIHALVASLCSVHCASHTRELNKGRGSEALVRTPVLCLPRVLARLGYRTVFIQGGAKEFAGKGDFLGAHGFSEVHGRPELEARFPGQHISHWGMHDDVLVSYTKEQILRLEALQRKDGRPFFVMMLTLDTHSPGLAPPTYRLPTALSKISKDRDSRNMIRSLHSTDRALSQLGHFIANDPARNKQTIWALTGDHPTSAMKFVRELHAKHRRQYTGWSGALPLLLYDPVHALPRRVPVLSSHLDLAPTLLHMLEVREVPNAMTGHSIFGRRPSLPMLVGRVGPKYVALYAHGITRSMTPTKLQAMCERGEPVLRGRPRALSSCELLAWLRWQDALWTRKRLLPEALAR